MDTGNISIPVLAEPFDRILVFAMQQSGLQLVGVKFELLSFLQKKSNLNVGTGKALVNAITLSSLTSSIPCVLKESCLGMGTISEK